MLPGKHPRNVPRNVPISRAFFGFLLRRTIFGKSNVGRSSCAPCVLRPALLCWSSRSRSQLRRTTAGR
eukprot:7024667-Prymnesium_polylepis.1